MKVVEELKFRCITNNEKERAYSIIYERTEWLRSKNIKQWTDPLPLKEFEERQSRGENFGLFHTNQLAVFLSIVKMNHPYWEQETGGTETWWLETLATANEFSGKQLGQIAVKKAIEHLKSRGESNLYLDCVKGNNFLPDYYGKLGFKRLLEKDIDFPKCGLTHMILMKYDL